MEDKYKNLPYAAKEAVNLFALNKLSDYEALQEFNKISDYEPCEYSNPLIAKCGRVYKRKMGQFINKKNKLVGDYRKIIIDIRSDMCMCHILSQRNLKEFNTAVKCGIIFLKPPQSYNVVYPELHTQAFKCGFRVLCEFFKIIEYESSMASICHNLRLKLLIENHQDVKKYLVKIFEKKNIRKKNI